MINNIISKSITEILLKCLTFDNSLLTSTYYVI